jgi:hypothetical protein
MDDKKVAFVPFHAINQFMVDDFRQHVVGEVLNGMEHLEAGKRNAYQNIIKNSVKVPGFRNSALAPKSVKMKGAISAFEKSPKFTILTLSCWADLNGDLRQKVYDLLVKRGWEILPMDADRTKLPGFIVKWHPTDTYEVINSAFKEMYGDDTTPENDVRLMTVWLSTRLPYDSDEGSEEESKENQV